ncbi:MAG: hypothetical protein BGO25_00690 [Acidobacteriales bacterium 59-55]|nr:DUF4097 family beta strand repeat protein [Terriglobales bacterium]OJV39782.1 MAG: hypothetical protein BGO25_00690 [Acidobacteriales bacterium 59-55]
MATNPPPYPPPGPPYGNDWKYQRRMMKEQARAQRDMLRAQAAAYRYRARAQRHGSIVGPLIIIAIGIVFLLVQMGRLSSRQVWDWYGHWWPVLLIGAGVVMFLEWAFDQYTRSTDPSQPVYRRGMGGGVFSLLLLLVIVGVVFSGLRHGDGFFFRHGFHISQDNLDQFLGDKHESDQMIVQAFPAGASFSVNNPRGDVSVSGTSDDNQIHVSVHKEVYSRSDSDASNKAEQLNPQVEVSGSNLILTVPSLPGGRADLTIMVPATAATSVTANHGDVRVSSIKGSVSVTANHGDVDLSAITGPTNTHINNGDSSFSAHSVTGEVIIEGRGQDLTLSDLSGPVSINGDFFGTTHIEHVRDSIRFHSSRTDMQLGRLDGEADISNNADLSVSDAVGPFTISTRSRNITLDRIAGNVSVTNRNGSVNLTSAPPLGNVTIENRNGSVTLTVPEQSSFSVDAETINGGLYNDFSLPTRGTDTHKSFSGTVGSNGPMLRITTSQGDIALKKAAILPLPPTPPEPPKLTFIPPTARSAVEGASVRTKHRSREVIVDKTTLNQSTSTESIRPSIPKDQ